MISITLSWVQILIWAITIVATYVLVVLIGSRVIKEIVTSVPYLQWQIKKQKKIKDLQEKSQRQLVYEKLNTLAQFMMALDKKLGSSKQKKQFWMDFALSPKSREYHVNKMIAEFAPEVKVKKVINVNKEEKNKVTDKNSKKSVDVQSKDKGKTESKDTEKK